MMDSWLSVFKERIMPTSAQYGITIHVAWVNRPQNEFIWVRSYESAEKLQADNTSPERAAYSELTSPHVAKIEVREVEGVIGELTAAN
jgi:quinol monooxygenase YgiN